MLVLFFSNLGRTIALACGPHHPTVKESAFLLLDFLFMALRRLPYMVSVFLVQNIKLCMDESCVFILSNKIHQINFFTREKVVYSALTWLPLTTLPVHVGVTPRRHAGIRNYRQATAKNHRRAQLSDSCQLHVRVSRCLWGFWVLTSPLVCSDISYLSFSCQGLIMCVLSSLLWAFM